MALQSAGGDGPGSSKRLRLDAGSTSSAKNDDVGGGGYARSGGRGLSPGAAVWTGRLAVAAQSSIARDFMLNVMIFI